MTVTLRSPSKKEAKVYRHKFRQSGLNHRNLDQLETLSKKLKSKIVRAEAPSHFIAATRLLAREGINAEQLVRNMKLFELKDGATIFITNGMNSWNKTGLPTN
ncbi:unnamed protein product [Vicia faba]|uniref:Uncharacterized protein n=1 Tax=Vicia faba TaxID=3906 RepID=A0AAV0ZM84_VICFA|nr:unnamed protein product [Vicia faba]